MVRGRGPRRRSTITKKVGGRLRALREERGLSVAEVARRAGTSPAAVRFVEAGERAPTIVSVEALCRALGVPLAALFSGKSDVPPAAPADRILLRLVGRLRGRPARQLQSVEKLLAAFDRAIEREGAAARP